MADNRMFLVHVPSGRMLLLGKMYDTDLRWYHPDDDNPTNKFFQSVRDDLFWCGAEESDFALAMEESDKPYVLTDWSYNYLGDELRIRSYPNSAVDIGMDGGEDEPATSSNE